MSRSEEAAFLEAGRENVFTNQVPKKGFRLARVGESINLGDYLEKKNVQSEKILVSLHHGESSREGEEGALLLFPQTINTVQVFPFAKKREVLYQRFADLENEADILAFANEHGSLLGRGVRFLDELKAGAESIMLWKREIAHMSLMIEAARCYEERIPARQFLFWPEENPYLFAIVRTAYDLPVDNSFVIFDLVLEEDVSNEIESVGLLPSKMVFIWDVKSNTPSHEILFEGMVKMCNEKLAEFACSQGYFVSKPGRARSCIFPQNLAGALWLQFAQTFFKDGPEDVESLPRRCYMCGKYDYPRDEYGDLQMHQCKDKNSPYFGLYYHEKCYRNKLMRELREKKAAAAGKNIRKRANRKQYLDE